MPNVTNLYTPKFLTGVSIADADKSFIAAKVAPIIVTQDQSGFIAKIDEKREGNRLSDFKIGSDGVYPAFTIETDRSSTYYCQKYGLEFPIPDELVTASRPETRLALQGAKWVVNKLLLDREKRLVTKIAAEWTSTNTSVPSTKWDQYSSATPIANIAAKIAYVQTLKGVRPNALAMDIQVLDNIWQCDELQKRLYNANPIGTQIQTSSTTDSRAAILAGLLGLREVNVASNVTQNTAAFDATAVTTNVWSDNVFLYTTGVPDELGSQVTMAHVLWNGFGDAGGIQDGIRVETTRGEERRHITYVNGTIFEDQLTLNLTTAHLFTDVLT